MATAADPAFAILQRIQSRMKSFDESLSQLCTDNISESALELQKNLTEYYHNLHRDLQSRYKTLKVKEEEREEPGTLDKNEEEKTSKVAGSSVVSSLFTKILSSVEARPEIKTLCDKADGDSLKNYIIDNINEFETLQKELAVAFSGVPDAAKLVIKALDSYDFAECGLTHIEEKRPQISINRKSRILLLDSLFLVFGNDDSRVVQSDVKDSARKIAKAWRKEIKFDKYTVSTGKGDLRAFLKLLASFKIAADYPRDELWGLLFIISSSEQTPELCRSLGLSPYISEFIDKLSESGQPLEALRYADTFGILDKVDAVDLLTSFLRELEKAEKERNMSAFQPSNYISRLQSEMTAVGAVIELVRKYGLQSHFPEDKLKKLEQEREDRIKKRKKEKERKLIRKQERKKKKEREKASKKIEQEEDGKKTAEKNAQLKRFQSFEPGRWLSERENYASKRAMHASSNEITRVAGGMNNSKASPYNVDGAQNKYGIIGHDHRPSDFSAANTGLTAGAFASAPSIAAQINNERRLQEGHPLSFGTVNLPPIGSSLYSSGVPADAFAGSLPNGAEVNHKGREQQSYTMNFGENDKNHVRTSVYGTGDLANSFATQSKYNFGGRCEESYKLNFGEIDNNPVRASGYVTGISANPSAIQCHYERRVPELYASTFGSGNTGSIVSSVYGSNLRTIPSNVNQVSHERSLGQSSGFAGRNMVPAESSGYGSGVSTAPPSSASQGHFDSRGSVIDRYRFNSGSTR